MPDDGPTPGRYNTRHVSFWTCGFFAGSLYCLLERSAKYPKYVPTPPGGSDGGTRRETLRTELLRLCRAWAAPLHEMAKRTDTHDLGFMTQPALRQDWELAGNRASLDSLATTAKNLASRYDQRVRAVRSWDRSVNKRYSYTDTETDFLVIVDSMCSMVRPGSSCFPSEVK